MVWRNNLREIDQHTELRTRGPAARGSRRRLDARAVRQLRDYARYQPHYGTPTWLPSSSPLTEWGFVLVALGVVLVVAIIALIVHLH